MPMLMLMLNLSCSIPLKYILIVLCSSLLFSECVVLCSVVLCCLILYGVAIVLCCIGLCCLVLCCIVLCVMCVVFCCIVLKVSSGSQCVYLLTCFSDRDVQMDGMPSGGVPSKVATSVVLSNREREIILGLARGEKRMPGFAKTRMPLAVVCVL